MKKTEGTKLLFDKYQSIKANSKTAIILNAIELGAIIIAVIVFILAGAIAGSSQEPQKWVVGAIIGYIIIGIGALVGIAAFVFNLIVSITALNAPVEYVSKDPVAYDIAKTIKGFGIALLLMSIFIGGLFALIFEAIIISKVNRFNEHYNR
ncbi:MAG: hypothetical protein L3I91_01510 [Mycoplasma sp.]